MSSRHDSQPQHRFVHELVLYDGPETLVDAVLPFVRDGLASSDTVILRMPDADAQRVVGAVGPTPRLEVFPHDLQRRPASDLQAFRSRFDGLEADSPLVRVVNVMPPIRPDRWWEWRRYEAAANEVLAPYPVWGLCVYDSTLLGASMRDGLERAHPRIGLGTRHGPSEAYAGPHAFDDDWAQAPALPDEDARPAIDLPDPDLPAARDAVNRCVSNARLDDGNRDALVFATTEAIVNAQRHGRRPISLRVWWSPSRVVAAVSDAGPGPRDPFVGLVAGEDHFGLWLVHQIVDVVHRRHDGGYTISIVAGT